MNITITDGAETATLNTPAGVDTAIQRLVDKHNSTQDPPGTMTRAQFVRTILIDYVQERARIFREERLVERFKAASEAAKSAAEAALP